MVDDKFRALLLCTDPVQYGSPMWRLTAQRLEFEELARAGEPPSTRLV